MEQIGVIGLSYRHADAEEIARFAIRKQDVPERLAAFRDTLSTGEIVYLATCNRVEVLFATADGAAAQDRRREVFKTLTGRDPQPGEARAALRAWTDEAAVEHLFLVACGLDSAQAGEREIAAQLRGAWDAARAAGVCGPILDRILGEALSMASRMQRIAAHARPPSLADLAAERVLVHLAEKPGSVALVGVSPMTRRCGELLHQAGVSLIVVNRSAKPAEEFAEAVAAWPVTLEQFRANPRNVAALVLATGGAEPVFDGAALARIAQAAAVAPLIIDFGLPANVEPEAAREHGLLRVGMNEMIQAAQDRRMSQLLRLAPVRAAIDERLTRLRGQLATRAIGRQLADLHGAFEQIATAEADRLLAEDLHGLDSRQRERIRRFATTIARRLAHLPLAGMRAAAAHASAEAIDAFFREARLRRAQHRDAEHTDERSQ